MLTPFISIFIFVLSSRPVTPPKPNFIVPVEFPDLGRYIKPFPIDKSLLTVKAPEIEILLLPSINSPYPPLPDCNIKRLFANVLNIISPAAAEDEKAPVPPAIPKL